MKTWTCFLQDDSARIPFSVIGVFLILGSSFTTVYVSQLEMQKASEIASTIDFNEVENLIRYAEADIANALNIAGIKGLKEIGKRLVVTIEDNTGYGNTVDEINCNRVKEIIMDELNIYLTGNYLYDFFNDGRYAVNVVIPEGEIYPVTSRVDISFRTIDMHMERFTIPFIGPEAEKDHATYWVAEIPIDIEIKKLEKMEGSEAITTQRITVSSLITSRYPLLKSLVDEYHETINGISPLWTFTTVFSNIYSLARGYKHYSSGKPLNVVDNKHLALIANGGLLLEQSLVFSSVDPLGLVEFAIETGKTLKGSGEKPLTDVFNNDMTGEGFAVDPNDFSQGSANFDAGDDFNMSIDDCPYLDVSEIAERILYNISSVTLVFENDAGNIVSETIDFTGDIQEKISDAVSHWAENSYFLNKTIKHLQRNGTANNLICDIAPEIYHADMHTKVAERQIIEEIWGNHGDYNNDGGYSPWTYNGFSFISSEVLKPEKGLVGYGSELYAETYNAFWWRTHYWYKWVEQNISGNITLVKVWNNVTDNRVEEVTLKILLDNFASFKDTQNDIVDVLYYNSTVNDPNLEDTLGTYINMFPDSNSEKQELIQTGTVGATDLYYSVPGNYNAWIEEESWNALDDILRLIGEIELDPSINATNYPNPLELVDKAKDDLLMKYNNNIDLYLNLSAYQSNSLFDSVGKKSVYYARDWYVYRVKTDIENVFSRIENLIDKQIEDAIPSDVGFDAQGIKDTLSEAGESLRNQFTIPFGFDINLIRNDDDNNFQWNETVRLAVDQYPNYLDPFEETTYEGVDYYSLGLKNICTLGPTGFPILPPTPVTPWIATLNVWVIEVKGEYAEFKVIDSSDETLFNPLFGHEPQIFLRKDEQIFNMDETILLGENTRLKFGFTTVAFGVVPSWGMMVGDIEGGWAEQNGLQ